MKFDITVKESNEREARRVLKGKCSGFKTERFPGIGVRVTVYGIGLLDYFNVMKELMTL